MMVELAVALMLMGACGESATRHKPVSTGPSGGVTGAGGSAGADTSTGSAGMGGTAGAQGPSSMESTGGTGPGTGGAGPATGGVGEATGGGGEATGGASVPSGGGGVPSGGGGFGKGGADSGIGGAGPATGGVGGTTGDGSPPRTGGAGPGTGGTSGGGGGSGSQVLGFEADIWPVFDKIREPPWKYYGTGSYDGCTTGGVCHGGSNPGAGLKMTDPGSAYRAFIDVPSVSSLCAGTIRVIAGEPDRSCLVLFYQQRLRDELNWVGQAEIDLVRRWIAQGARP